MGPLHVVLGLLRKHSTFALSHQHPHNSPQEKGRHTEGSLTWHCTQGGQRRGVVSHLSPGPPPSCSITESPSHPAPCSHEHWALSSAGQAWHTVREKHCAYCHAPCLGTEAKNNRVPPQVQCLLPSCQEEASHRVNGEEDNHVLLRKRQLPSCPLGSARRSGFSRDLVALSPDTRLHSPKNKSRA